MADWRQMTRLGDAELSRLDIAAVNLACAAGLPGVGNVDIAGYTRALDAWAGMVRRYTALAYEQTFLRDPGQFDHSEPVFRVVCLVSALQKHAGVRYDPRFAVPNFDAPFPPEAEFVHGVIGGPGGTCATLPVVYSAVGRRLGYPIRLARTRAHLFNRWDDPVTRTCLNFDGSNRGVNVHPDDHYRAWPFPVTHQEEQEHGYLRSLTPRQELAEFVAGRGFQFLQAGDYRQGADMLTLGHELSGTSRRFLTSLTACYRHWYDRQRSRLPPGFPQVWVELPHSARRWPALSREIEAKRWLMEMVDWMLTNREFEADWWAPVRCGRPPAKPMPTEVTFRIMGG